MTNISQVIEVLKGMNYTVVHEWYESHGDGGVMYFQRPAPFSCKPDVVSVAFDCDRNATRFVSPRGNEDYLLAAEIIADVHNETWEPVSPKRISPCCTAAWQDYCYNGVYPRYVRVSSIAGHGTIAVVISKDEVGK